MSDSTPETEPYFRVCGLETRLGKRTIFDRLDLDIHNGESVVIMGRSGEGKSVLLQHLLGLMKPNGGDIYIKGANIISYSEEELRPLRKKMGIMFQDGALFDFLTVAENVSFPLSEAGVSDEEELNEKARQALEMVGLAEHMNVLPMNLSGGMRKRVALARATVGHPDCILCDEPTAGLDPVAAGDINELIREMVDAYRATSVVVTHDISSMNQIADRVVMLMDGKIIFSGSPKEIHESENVDVRDFLAGRTR